MDVADEVQEVGAVATDDAEPKSKKPVFLNGWVADGMETRVLLDSGAGASIVSPSLIHTLRERGQWVEVRDVRVRSKASSFTSERIPT